MALILQALALVWLWLSSCWGGGHVTETWVSCLADEAALAVSSTRQSSFPARSLLHCLSLGTNLDWVVLACYSPVRVGKECDLWAFDALTVGAIVKNSSLGHTPCKTLRKQQGCHHPNGTLVQKGKSYAYDFCSGMLLVCQDDNNFYFHGALAPLTKCAFPFTMTTIGCIHFAIDQNLTWCKARQQCLQYGGDLLSADTHEEFDAVRAYTRMEYGGSYQNDLWAGLNMEAGEWRWLFSGRSPGPNQQGDWTAFDPNGVGDMCARLRVPEDFTMADTPCSNTYYAFCRARLVPKL